MGQLSVENYFYKLFAVDSLCTIVKMHCLETLILCAPRLDIMTLRHNLLDIHHG